MKNLQNRTLSSNFFLSEIRDTSLILAGAVFVPILIHLVPAHLSIPWGARLLPMYYAPFVGIMLVRPRTGFIVAVLAPGVNALITGSPDSIHIIKLTLELLFFTGICTLIITRLKGFRWCAPLSGFITKAISSIIFGGTVITALPGIFVLGIINYILTISKTNGSKTKDRY